MRTVTTTHTIESIEVPLVPIHSSQYSKRILSLMEQLSVALARRKALEFFQSFSLKFRNAFLSNLLSAYFPDAQIATFIFIFSQT